VESWVDHLDVETGIKGLARGRPGHNQTREHRKRKAGKRAGKKKKGKQKKKC